MQKLCAGKYAVPVPTVTVTKDFCARADLPWYSAWTVALAREDMESNNFGQQENISYLHVAIKRQRDMDV